MAAAPSAAVSAPPPADAGRAHSVKRVAGRPPSREIPATPATVAPDSTIDRVGRPPRADRRESWRSLPQDFSQTRQTFGLALGNRQRLLATQHVRVAKPPIRNAAGGRTRHGARATGPPVIQTCYGQKNINGPLRRGQTIHRLTAQPTRRAVPNRAPIRRARAPRGIQRAKRALATPAVGVAILDPKIHIKRRHRLVAQKIIDDADQKIIHGGRIEGFQNAVHIHVSILSRYAERGKRKSRRPPARPRPG